MICDVDIINSQGEVLKEVSEGRYDAAIVKDITFKRSLIDKTYKELIKKIPYTVTKYRSSDEFYKALYKFKRLGLSEYRYMDKRFNTDSSDESMMPIGIDFIISEILSDIDNITTDDINLIKSLESAVVYDKKANDYGVDIYKIKDSFDKYVVKVKDTSITDNKAERLKSISSYIMQYVKGYSNQMYADMLSTFTEAYYENRKAYNLLDTILTFQETDIFQDNNLNLSDILGEKEGSGLDIRFISREELIRDYAHIVDKVPAKDDKTINAFVYNGDIYIVEDNIINKADKKHILTEELLHLITIYLQTKQSSSLNKLIDNIKTLYPEIYDKYLEGLNMSNPNEEELITIHENIAAAIIELLKNKESLFSARKDSVSYLHRFIYAVKRLLLKLLGYVYHKVNIYNEIDDLFDKVLKESIDVDVFNSELVKFIKRWEIQGEVKKVNFPAVLFNRDNANFFNTLTNIINNANDIIYDTQTKEEEFKNLKNKYELLLKRQETIPVNISGNESRIMLSNLLQSYMELLSSINTIVLQMEMANLASFIVDLYNSALSGMTSKDVSGFVNALNKARKDRGSIHDLKAFAEDNTEISEYISSINNDVIRQSLKNTLSLSSFWDDIISVINSEQDSVYDIFFIKRKNKNINFLLTIFEFNKNIGDLTSLKDSLVQYVENSDVSTELNSLFNEGNNTIAMMKNIRDVAIKLMEKVFIFKTQDDFIKSNSVAKSLESVTFTKDNDSIMPYKLHLNVNKTTNISQAVKFLLAEITNASSVELIKGDNKESIIKNYTDMLDHIGMIIYTEIVKRKNLNYKNNIAQVLYVQLVNYMLSKESSKISKEEFRKKIKNILYELLPFMYEDNDNLIRESMTSEAMQYFSYEIYENNSKLNKYNIRFIQTLILLNRIEKSLGKDFNKDNILEYLGKIYMGEEHLDVMKNTYDIVSNNIDDNNSVEVKSIMNYIENQTPDKFGSIRSQIYKGLNAVTLYPDVNKIYEMFDINRQSGSPYENDLYTLSYAVNKVSDEKYTIVFPSSHSLIDNKNSSKFLPIFQKYQELSAFNNILIFVQTYAQKEEADVKRISDALLGYVKTEGINDKADAGILFNHVFIEWQLEKHNYKVVDKIYKFMISKGINNVQNVNNVDNYIRQLYDLVKDDEVYYVEQGTYKQKKLSFDEFRSMLFRFESVTNDTVYKDIGLTHIKSIYAQARNNKDKSIIVRNLAVALNGTIDNQMRDVTSVSKDKGNKIDLVKYNYYNSTKSIDLGDSFNIMSAAIDDIYDIDITSIRDYLSPAVAKALVIAMEVGSLYKYDYNENLTESQLVLDNIRVLLTELINNIKSRDKNNIKLANMAAYRFLASYEQYRQKTINTEGNPLIAKTNEVLTILNKINTNLALENINIRNRSLAEYRRINNKQAEFLNFAGTIFQDISAQAYYSSPDFDKVVNTFTDIYNQVIEVDGFTNEKVVRQPHLHLEALLRRSMFLFHNRFTTTKTNNKPHNEHILDINKGILLTVKDDIDKVFKMSFLHNLRVLTDKEEKSVMIYIKEKAAMMNDKLKSISEQDIKALGSSGVNTHIIEENIADLFDRTKKLMDLNAEVPGNGIEQKGIVEFGKELLDIINGYKAIMIDLENLKNSYNNLDIRKDDIKDRTQSITNIIDVIDKVKGKMIEVYGLYSLIGNLKMMRRTNDIDNRFNKPLIDNIEQLVKDSKLNIDLKIKSRKYNAREFSNDLTDIEVKDVYDYFYHLIFHGFGIHRGGVSVVSNVLLDSIDKVVNSDKESGGNINPLFCSFMLYHNGVFDTIQSKRRIFNYIDSYKSLDKLLGNIQESSEFMNFIHYFNLLKEYLDKADKSGLDQTLLKHIQELITVMDAAHRRKSLDENDLEHFKPFDLNKQDDVKRYKEYVGHFINVMENIYLSFQEINILDKIIYKSLERYQIHLNTFHYHKSVDKIRNHIVKEVMEDISLVDNSLFIKNINTGQSTGNVDIRVTLHNVIKTISKKQIEQIVRKVTETVTSGRYVLLAETHSDINMFLDNKYIVDIGAGNNNIVDAGMRVKDSLNAPNIYTDNDSITITGGSSQDVLRNIYSFGFKNMYLSSPYIKKYTPEESKNYIVQSHIPFVKPLDIDKKASVVSFQDMMNRIKFVLNNGGSVTETNDKILLHGIKLSLLNGELNVSDFSNAVRTLANIMVNTYGFDYDKVRKSISGDRFSAKDFDLHLLRFIRGLYGLSLKDNRTHPFKVYMSKGLFRDLNIMIRNRGLSFDNLDDPALKKEVFDYLSKMENVIIQGVRRVIDRVYSRIPSLVGVADKYTFTIESEVLSYVYEEVLGISGGRLGLIRNNDNGIKNILDRLARNIYDHDAIRLLDINIDQARYRIVTTKAMANAETFMKDKNIELSVIKVITESYNNLNKVLSYINTVNPKTKKDVSTDILWQLYADYSNRCLRINIHNLLNDGMSVKHYDGNITEDYTNHYTGLTGDYLYEYYNTSQGPISNDKGYKALRWFYYNNDILRRAGDGYGSNIHVLGTNSVTTGNVFERFIALTKYKNYRPDINLYLLLSHNESSTYHISDYRQILNTSVSEGKNKHSSVSKYFDYINPLLNTILLDAISKNQSNNTADVAKNIVTDPTLYNGLLTLSGKGVQSIVSNSKHIKIIKEIAGVLSMFVIFFVFTYMWNSIANVVATMIMSILYMRFIERMTYKGVFLPNIEDVVSLVKRVSYTLTGIVVGVLDGIYVSYALATSNKRKLSAAEGIFKRLSNTIYGNQTNILTDELLVASGKEFPTATIKTKASNLKYVQWATNIPLFSVPYNIKTRTEYALLKATILSALDTRYIIGKDKVSNYFIVTETSIDINDENVTKEYNRIMDKINRGKGIKIYEDYFIKVFAGYVNAKTEKEKNDTKSRVIGNMVKYISDVSSKELLLAFHQGDRLGLEVMLGDVASKVLLFFRTFLYISLFLVLLRPIISSVKNIYYNSNINKLRALASILKAATTRVVLPLFIFKFIILIMKELILRTWYKHLTAALMPKFVDLYRGLSKDICNIAKGNREYVEDAKNKISHMEAIVEHHRKNLFEGLFYKDELSNLQDEIFKTGGNKDTFTTFINFLIADVSDKYLDIHDGLQKVYNELNEFQNDFTNENYKKALNDLKSSYSQAMKRALLARYVIDMIKVLPKVYAVHYNHLPYKGDKKTDDAVVGALIDGLSLVYTKFMNTSGHEDIEGKITYGINLFKSNGFRDYIRSKRHINFGSTSFDELSPEPMLYKTGIMDLVNFNKGAFLFNTVSQVDVFPNLLVGKAVGYSVNKLYQIIDPGDAVMMSLASNGDVITFNRAAVWGWISALFSKYNDLIEKLSNDKSVDILSFDSRATRDPYYVTTHDVSKKVRTTKIPFDDFTRKTTYAVSDVFTGSEMYTGFLNDIDRNIEQILSGIGIDDDVICD